MIVQKHLKKNKAIYKMFFCSLVLFFLEGPLEVFASTVWPKEMNVFYTIAESKKLPTTLHSLDPTDRYFIQFTSNVAPNSPEAIALTKKYGGTHPYNFFRNNMTSATLSHESAMVLKKESIVQSVERNKLIDLDGDADAIKKACRENLAGKPNIRLPRENAQQPECIADVTVVFLDAFAIDYPELPKRSSHGGKVMRSYFQDLRVQPKEKLKTVYVDIGLYNDRSKCPPMRMDTESFYAQIEQLENKIDDGTYQTPMVVNMSFGHFDGNLNEIEKGFIERLSDKGVIFVKSAGNIGSTAVHHSDIINVGSVEESLSQCSDKELSSNCQAYCQDKTGEDYCEEVTKGKYGNPCRNRDQIHAFAKGSSVGEPGSSFAAPRITAQIAAELCQGASPAKAREAVLDSPQQKEYKNDEKVPWENTEEACIEETNQSSEDQSGADNPPANSVEGSHSGDGAGDGNGGTSDQTSHLADITPGSIANSSDAANASEGLVSCGNRDQVRCTICHFFKLGFDIVKWGTGIMGIIFFVVLGIAGVLYIVSTGSPGLIGTAKKAMTAAIIGIIVMLTAWILVTTVINVLARGTVKDAAGNNGAFNGTQISGPWYLPQVQCAVKNYDGSAGSL